jgi:hypothetical protein
MIGAAIDDAVITHVPMANTEISADTRRKMLELLAIAVRSFVD